MNITVGTITYHRRDNGAWFQACGVEMPRRDWRWLDEIERLTIERDDALQDLHHVNKYLAATDSYVSRLLDAILDACIVMGDDMPDGLPTDPPAPQFLVERANEWRTR